MEVTLVQVDNIGVGADRLRVFVLQWHKENLTQGCVVLRWYRENQELSLSLFLTLFPVRYRNLSFRSSLVPSLTIVGMSAGSGRTGPGWQDSRSQSSVVSSRGSDRILDRGCSNSNLVGHLTYDRRRSQLLPTPKALSLLSRPLGWSSSSGPWPLWAPPASPWRDPPCPGTFVEKGFLNSKSVKTQEDKLGNLCL